MRICGTQWLGRLALAMAPVWLAGSVWAALPDPVRFGASIEQGDLATVREWLEAGLDADFLADRIGSGLMIAAWQGDIPMMALFLEHGARIGLSNQYDEEALQLAAWKGHLEAVQWLLAHGATINRPGRWNALHYAAFADRREIAGLLLERGAQINAPAPNGSTALMMTAREGREELARQLLDAGADPGLKNENGDTALTWAMRHEHFRIAKMVSTAAEFARVAKAAPESFGSRQRSVPAPSEIDEILRQIRLAEAARQPAEALRKSLFEAVARFKKDSQRIALDKARPGKPAQRGKPQALLITAKRQQKPAGGEESAELVYAKGMTPATPAAADPAEILERMARARAAGQPLSDLRKAFFEAVNRFKSDNPPASPQAIN